MTCSTSYCRYDTMIHGMCIRTDDAQRVMPHNFFPLQVTELESYYFRQYKFQLPLYYVQVCKGCKHMIPLLQLFTIESTRLVITNYVL